MYGYVGVRLHYVMWVIGYITVNKEHNFITNKSKVIIDRTNSIEYSTNMTTNFTKDGIMVSEGQVIARNVSVSTSYNGEENFLTLSYTDGNGIYNRTTKNFHEYTMMVDHVSKTIDGVLPHNEDWYLFWKNQNSAPLFGV